MQQIDDIVRNVFAQDSDSAFGRLINDKSRVFWVKWSQRDETIPAACEAILNTGKLSAERNEDILRISFGERSETVQLTDEPEDRHTTLLAVNKVMSGHAEIRFVWESIGADAGAFLPLPLSDWQSLEAAMPLTVQRRVLALTPELNVFTQVTPRMKPKSLDPAPEPSLKPWWKFWA